VYLETSGNQTTTRDLKWKVYSLSLWDPAESKITFRKNGKFKWKFKLVWLQRESDENLATKSYPFASGFPTALLLCTYIHTYMYQFLNHLFHQKKFASKMCHISIQTPSKYPLVSNLNSSSEQSGKRNSIHALKFYAYSVTVRRPRNSSLIITRKQDEAKRAEQKRAKLQRSRRKTKWTFLESAWISIKNCAISESYDKSEESKSIIF
jgi:hypothetical protein